MKELVSEIRSIIESARTNAVRSNLAKEIEPMYGSGFGQRQLEYSRRFYLEFPIAHTVCAQLNWSQYKEQQLIAEVEKVKKEWEESR